MDHVPVTPLGPGLQRAWAAPSTGGRLRVVPWQGDRYTALIGPGRSGRRPTGLDLHRCIDALHARGVRAAVTPALSPLDGQAFLQAGFRLHERLHLLAYRLDERRTHRFMQPESHLSRSEGRTLKPGRPWHRRVVLDIDRRAFEPFWQFDTNSLSEARRATPTSRYRVALERGNPLGYAVTGRAGDRGYLQRLAVEPDVQSGGIGSALVHDSLRWLNDRGVGTAMVNTQERNTRALGLYEHLGFRRQPEGLLVLRWDAER